MPAPTATAEAAAAGKPTAPAGTAAPSVSGAAPQGAAVPAAATCWGNPDGTPLPMLGRAAAASYVPLTMHPDEEAYLRKDLATAECHTAVAAANIVIQNRYLNHAQMLKNELDATRRALSAALNKLQAR